MGDTTTRRSSRPLYTALAWAVGLLLASMVPGGGLIAATAAVFTTYREASLKIKLVWLAVGVLTVLMQISTFFVFGVSGSSSPVQRVD